MTLPSGQANHESQSPVRNLPRFGNWAFAAACAAFGLYLLWFAFNTPNVTGLFDDDAVYQVTAKSLAEGRGYLRIDRPGEPHQTKYPPLYPLILSAFWNLGGGFPGNIGWLRVPAVISAVALILLGVRYVAKFTCIGPPAVCVVALACLSLPEWRLFTTTTMSELPFAALAFAALWATERSATAAGRKTLAWAATAGTLAGLALLTRTVGVTLAAAIVLWLCWQRKWVAAALAAVPALLCAGGWKLWSTVVTAPEAALRQSPLLRYDLDYSAWFPPTVADAAHVAWQNLVQFVFLEFQLALRLPGRALAELFKSGNGAPFWHALAWFALLCVIVGWIYSARTRLSVAHIFIALYAGLSLVWPFGPNRFVLPIFPLLIAYLLCGAGVILQLLTTRLSCAVRQRFILCLLSLFAIAIVWLNLQAWPTLFSVKDNVCRMGGMQMSLTAQQQTAEWLKAHTPPNSIIASRRSSLTYLATGRKTTILTPYNNPVAYHYSRNRRFDAFYLPPAPDEWDAVKRDADQLLRLYGELGVTHLIRTGEDELERLFFVATEACLQANPKRFRIAWIDQRLKVAVLEIVPAP